MIESTQPGIVSSWQTAPPGKIVLALAVAGILLYSASFNDPFHFDDVLIVNDSNVSNADRWTHFFNPLHLRQLTFFTFFLNHRVGALDPTGYHIINVLLHAANACLFFVLLRGLFDQRLAAIAATIFLVHPIQTEPVLYIYQRSILLACFFSLLGLLAMQAKRRVLAGILFFCAFESKESALVVPLLALLVDYYRTNATRRLTSYLKVVVPVIAAAAVTLAVLSYRGEGTVGLGALDEVPPLTYLMTQTRVIYTYLRLLIFPFPQSLEYDFPWVPSVDAQVVLQFLGLAVLLTAGFVMARSVSWRMTGLAILSFFVLLAPTSSVIPSLDSAFEHRLYLPMLAFSVFAASLISRLRRPSLILVPLVTILSMATVSRGAVWSSEVALWEDTVRHTPNKARVWFNLGGAHIRSNPERAEFAFNRAIQLRPDFSEAFYNLGVIRQNQGNNREAVSFYERALALNARYWPAWNNLGNTFLALGQPERAISALEKTLSLNPDHWPAQYNVAIVHFTSGRFEKAIPRLKTVLAWRPDFRDARYLLATCLSRTGQSAEAEAEWKKVNDSGGQPPMPAPISGPTP